MAVQQVVAQYKQAGFIIDYQNTGVTDMVAGAVIDFGTYVGITLAPIPVNQWGGVAIRGVASFAKETGSAITRGAICLWDSTAQVAFVTGGGYTSAATIGKAIYGAASGDLYVDVLMDPYAETTTG